MEALETGVPNLDRILGGGILPRSTAMIIGTLGTGKTILAQQIAFHAASRGAHSLYLTGYSETHDKLVAHSSRLAFFEQEVIGQQLQFGSLPDLLLLRQGESPRPYRAFSVFKMRFSEYDPAAHEITITAGQGIRIVEEGS